MKEPSYPGSCLPSTIFRYLRKVSPIIEEISDNYDSPEELKMLPIGSVIFENI